MTQEQGTEGRDSKLVDIRIGQQQEQEAAIRGQDGKGDPWGGLWDKERDRGRGEGH